MRLLLDTQIALWWLTASPKLSKPARTLMAGVPCVVSVASIWEVSLKHHLGKLDVSPRRFRDEMTATGAAILSITDEHVLATLSAPHSLRDPFDGLLLNIALVEHLVLLTADEKLVDLAHRDQRFPVKDARDS